MSITDECPVLPDAALAGRPFQEGLEALCRDLHERAPVFRSAAGCVYLARHADCGALLGGARFGRRSEAADRPFDTDARPASAVDRMLDHWMMFMDPPRHTAVRRAFERALAAVAPAALESAAARAAAALLGALRGKVRADLIAEFAAPLPMMVICELLGLPAADRARFHEWSAALNRALDSGSQAEMQAAAPVSLAIRDYFAEYIASGKAAGGGGFAGALIAAGAEAGLALEELVYGCGFLIWAGHETTRNLIGNGVLALSKHPAEMARLRQHPDLAASAVNEILRYSSPVQKLSRWTSEAVAFGEFTVPPGTLVTALIGAANRDPAAFADPERFDIARAPNRQLAFGRGIHVCPGAPIARLEGRIAIAALLAAFEHIEEVEHRWLDCSALRGLERLVLALA